MKYLALQSSLKKNIFTSLDVAKLFAAENPQNIHIQLARFSRKGLIVSIKRGLYALDPRLVDELTLANLLYQPSYISLESALNYYGITPDVPQAVTSVNLTTTKKIQTPWGIFYYAKLKKELFFGFIKVRSALPGFFFNLARPEKALLDYLYLRKVKDISELRFNLKNLNKKRLSEYLRFFPASVQKIKL